MTDEIEMNQLVELYSAQLRDSEVHSIPAGSYRKNMTKQRIKELEDEYSQRMPHHFRSKSVEDLNQLFRMGYLSKSGHVFTLTKKAWNEVGVLPPKGFLTEKQWNIINQK